MYMSTSTDGLFIPGDRSVVWFSFHTSIRRLDVPVIQHWAKSPVKFGVDDGLETFPDSHAHVDQHSVLEPPEAGVLRASHNTGNGQEFALDGVADVVVAPEGVVLSFLCGDHLHQVQN